VLLDRDSLVVAYDPQRGEPRTRGVRRGALAGAGAGDCVDCGLCVAVCPTGIDIRDGLQLECIACTQCIDACNGVMAKVGRASDLIGYRSLAALEGRRTRFTRPRVIVYGVLLLAVGVAFTELLALRKPLELQVLHNSALYQRMADGRLGNAYTLHVQNRDRSDRVFRLRLEPRDDYELITGLNPLAVQATTTLETRVFVVARDPAIEDGGVRRVEFVLEELEHPDRRVRRSTAFVVPAGHGRARDAD
jgi:cytochrome c oxidase accessory protein FixG